MSSKYNQLVSAYPTVTFKKGEAILLKDEEPSAVFVLEKGIVKSYIITTDGVERQISMHDVGDDIPVGYALGLREHADYFYEAYSLCIIRIIPRGAYMNILRQDIETMYERYLRANTHLILSLARINALEHPKASDKVAFMLVSLAEEFGTRLRPYKTRFKLAMTQQEMANALGLTRETTGIELKKLEVKQVISRSRKSYVLYMERLRNYLDKR